MDTCVKRKSPHAKIGASVASPILDRPAHLDRQRLIRMMQVYIIKPPLEQTHHTRKMTIQDQVDDLRNRIKRLENILSEFSTKNKKAANPKLEESVLSIWDRVCGGATGAATVWSGIRKEKTHEDFVLMWIDERKKNRGYLFRGQINRKPEILWPLNKRSKTETVNHFENTRKEMKNMGFSKEQVLVTEDGLVERPGRTIHGGRDRKKT